jgi:hypothetical protein
MSAPDPKLGISCVATIFGLNYKGRPDPDDNGEGAFIDLSTGKPYDTRDEMLIGVSIPIPFYKRTLGMSREDIESKAVTVTIQDANGEYWFNLPIVDLGPGESGKLIRASDGPHLLDRTYGLCQQMKSMDDAKIVYWILKGRVPYSVQGQDTPYITI